MNVKLSIMFALSLIGIFGLITFSESFANTPPPPSLKHQLEQVQSNDELFCLRYYVLVLKQSDESPACVKHSSKEKLLERSWAVSIPSEQLSHMEKDKQLRDFTLVNSLRPGDKLEVKHSAGYTRLIITLSSWEEYEKWEDERGSEHELMPPIKIRSHTMNPIVFDLLYEMSQKEGYEISKHYDNLYQKKIQKDYSIPNHHSIFNWLKFEFNEQYGEKIDGSFSNHFEYHDQIYKVTQQAAD